MQVDSQSCSIYSPHLVGARFTQNLSLPDPHLWLKNVTFDEIEGFRDEISTYVVENINPFLLSLRGILECIGVKEPLTIFIEYLGL